MTCLLLVFSACSKTEDKEIAGNKENETETQEIATGETDSADSKEEEDESDEQEETSEDSATEETESKEQENDAPADPGLKVYQPGLGWEKKFTDGSEILVTEKVIAVNDEYVQLSITLGGNQSIQIYKWTETELALVYEEVSVEDSTVNLLDSFTPKSNPEILLSTNGTAAAQWEVLESGIKLDVEYGSFEDVYVLKKVTDEVEDADTIYTRYYAPGYGLVKETFEVTGDHGYSGATELASVEK
jgi:hypothetical protein